MTRLTVLALALYASPAAAYCTSYHCSDAASSAFQTMVDTMIYNALRPRYQPPPQIVYVPAPPVPPPSVQQRPRSQQAWKESIVAQAERFCQAYPTDPICHFTDDRK